MNGLKPKKRKLKLKFLEKKKKKNMKFNLGATLENMKTIKK